MTLKKEVMKTRRYLIGLLCCVGMMACQEDEPFGSGSPKESGLSLNISTDGLLNVYTVGSRADVKTPEEQEIKSLHVFIFDAEGNYLEASDQHRYQGYRSIPDGKTVMNIDRNGWADPEKAKTATVIAVANVEDGTFEFTSADTPPSNVADRGVLEAFVYKPLRGRYITELPESGMPMYGRVDSVDLTPDNNAQSIDISMKALLSRVDVNLRIDSEHADVTGRLPQLSLEKCKVLNVPQATRFTQNDAEETNLTELGKADYDFPPSALRTITNGDEGVSYTFYVFENLQEADRQEPDGGYPAGISDDEKQKYKPLLADRDNSMVFQFGGTYITYNGASYNVTYDLYLGANHTNDFKVGRNKQYKNDVTIKGIVNALEAPTHVTFDTRVNVEESNPYFVSMMKDRKLDCHFNVVPMDVYFFETTPSNPGSVEQSMKVEIEDPETAKWLRMEYVSATQMEAGTAPNGDCIATEKPWTAGNGKRKYFTTDLVTNTLAGNTSVTMMDSRDRIYFYVDENLDVWHLGDPQTNRTRTATLRLTYYEDDVEKGTREIVLEQSKLLEVTFHGPNNGGGNDETDGWADKIIYIEAYEEYRDHGDPLNEYESNQVFNGLPWEDYEGGSGTRIGRLDLLSSIYCSRNYYWGHEFTQKIVDEVEAVVIEGGWFEDDTYSYEHLTLNSKPKTAAGYCYIKNKRNADGSVPNPKWYLPGIRELERILEDYYVEYPEFQNNYYWSSAAGESGRIIELYENPNYARATKAYIGTDGNFHYYESGTGNTYTGESGEGGFTPRRQILRIRAARIDDQPQ